MRTWLVTVSFVGFLSGCAHVAPYDRGALARLTSSPGSDGAAAGHVKAVHEGATGGGSVATAGCGCN